MLRRRSSGKAVQAGSIDQKNVEPAVIVVIEDGHAGAGGLDDVLLGVGATEDILHGEARFFGDIGEVGDGFGWGGVRGSRRARLWLAHRTRR